MTHASSLYLDHPYEHDNREPGLSWAATRIGTRDVFNYHLPPAYSTASLTLPLVQRMWLVKELCRTYEVSKCINLTRPDNFVGKSANQLVW